MTEDEKDIVSNWIYGEVWETYWEAYHNSKNMDIDDFADTVIQGAKAALRKIKNALV